MTIVCHALLFMLRNFMFVFINYDFSIPHECPKFCHAVQGKFLSSSMNCYSVPDPDIRDWLASVAFGPTESGFVINCFGSRFDSNPSYSSTLCHQIDNRKSYARTQIFVFKSPIYFILLYENFFIFYRYIQ